MRRCKYYNGCGKKDTMNMFLNVLGYTNVVCQCSDYEPSCPELDPYWKDIFDETNRRLYDR